jgi:chorismate mutase
VITLLVEKQQVQLLPYASGTGNKRAGRVILIDPGHGGRDDGATGVVGGVKEKDLNIAIVGMLVAQLESMGYTVLQTRTETPDEFRARLQEDIASDPDYTTANASVRSEVSVPLAVNGVMLGVLLAVRFAVRVEVAGRAHAIAARAVALLVGMHAVLLVRLEPRHVGIDQDLVALLLERHSAGRRVAASRWPAGARHPAGQWPRRWGCAAGGVRRRTRSGSRSSAGR